MKNKLLKIVLFVACALLALLPQMAQAQPAPAISSFEISHVRSPQVAGGVWQRVRPWDVGTTANHGGAYIDVAVECLGYPSGHGAVMATFPMQYMGSQQIKNSRGQVTGFYLFYRISNRIPGGNASVWATSINTGRRWSDGLNIR